MKLLIIILVTCGQPDLVMMKPQGEPMQYAPYEKVDQRALKEEMETHDTEVWIVPNERGICT